MVRFHESLSEESVYLRYFHMAKLSTRAAHERLIRKCFIDYDPEMALVAELTDAHARNTCIAGVARLSRLPSSREAEISVVVADKFQHQGLGTEFHSENSAIHHLAKHGGADL